MNRTERRRLGAQQIPGVHCDDCNATAYIWKDKVNKGITHIGVEHDETCPAYRGVTL